MTLRPSIVGLWKAPSFNAFCNPIVCERIYLINPEWTLFKLGLSIKFYTATPSGYLFVILVTVSYILFGITMIGRLLVF